MVSINNNDIRKASIDVVLGDWRRSFLNLNTVHWSSVVFYGDFEHVYACWVGKASNPFETNVPFQYSLKNRKRDFLMSLRRNKEGTFASNRTKGMHVGVKLYRMITNIFVLNSLLIADAYLLNSFFSWEISHFWDYC